MTWRYQAYRYQDGTVGIHEQYNTSTVNGPSERAIIVTDAQPGDTPDEERQRVIDGLRKVLDMMIRDVDLHGVKDWPQ